MTILYFGYEIPFVTRYKHLGTVLEGTIDHTPTRDYVVNRCRSLLGALARLDILSAEEYVHAAKAVVTSVIGYYGRCTPIGLHACERIETFQRRCLAALNHRSHTGHVAQTYAPRQRGGLGACHAYDTARAVYIDQIDRALCSESGHPARTAIEIAIGQTYIQTDARVTCALIGRRQP